MQQSDSKTTYYNCQFQEELPVVAGQKQANGSLFVLLLFSFYLGLV